MLPLIAEWEPVNYSLNVYSQIGLVLLIGLVTKNGILIVEFANQIREQNPGKTVRQAVIEAARIRFRPIVMTSVATIFGAVPIAVGLGAGMDGRKPLGAVIVGGMLLATFLTLYLIPLMYDWIKSRQSASRV
jgi:multidrug efflux pump